MNKELDYEDCIWKLIYDDGSGRPKKGDTGNCIVCATELGYTKNVIGYSPECEEICIYTSNNIEQETWQYRFEEYCYPAEFCKRHIEELGR